MNRQLRRAAEREALKTLRKQRKAGILPPAPESSAASPAPAQPQAAAAPRKPIVTPVGTFNSYLELNNYMEQHKHEYNTAGVTLTPREPSLRESSESRIEANRRNAQHSTGPKTEAGKLACSQNSTKHGIYSKRLTEEDAELMDMLKNQFTKEHKPASLAENILVAAMAEHHFRWQRYRDMEEGLLNAAEFSFKHMDAIQRYMNAAERHFYKAFNTLRAVQKERRQAELAAAKEAPPAKSGFVSQSENAAPEARPVRSVSQQESGPQHARPAKSDRKAAESVRNAA